MGLPTDRPPALPPPQPSGVTCGLCPPHLPTDKMVISPWRPALAPALGVLAGLGRSLGAGVVAAAASGDSSTSGHFFWLQREQQGPESEARPCTVWRCWRCGQTCGMLGGPGGSLWGTQAGGSRGGAGPGDPGETGGETHPRAESPGGRPSTCCRGPACRLTWAEAGGWSAPAVGCGTPSAAPPAPRHSLWAAALRTWLWAAREDPPPHRPPAHSLLPRAGRVPFPPPLTEQERGQHRQPHGQRARLPEARRREGQSSALARGWGQTSLLTFLLCDQAHQDPNGVLTGVLRPAGRVRPWRRENHHDSREEAGGTRCCSPATPGFGSRGRPRPGCVRV